jgi:hypothetical protein
MPFVPAWAHGASDNATRTQHTHTHAHTHTHTHTHTHRSPIMQHLCAPCFAHTPPPHTIARIEFACCTLTESQRRIILTLREPVVEGGVRSQITQQLKGAYSFIQAFNPSILQSFNVIQSFNPSILQCHSITSNESIRINARPREPHGRRAQSALSITAGRQGWLWSGAN